MTLNASHLRVPLLGPGIRFEEETWSLGVGIPALCVYIIGSGSSMPASPDRVSLADEGEFLLTDKCERS